MNTEKNWCAVITSVWTIRRGKRRYSCNRGEQSLPSDIHRMGSKIFADVDWLSAHGAAGVSYIGILGTKRGLSLPSDKHRMGSKIDAGSQELLGRGPRCRVWWFESSVEWSSRRAVHFRTPRHHFKHGVNTEKNWCAVITSMWNGATVSTVENYARV